MKTTSLIVLAFLTCILLGCKKEGSEGKMSLLDFVIEPKGNNCSSGGFKVISGVDLNRNDILDSSEIQNTKFICNGNNGGNSLINVTPEPVGVNCSSGGYKVSSGADLNSNNILDNSEIQNSEYICNGDVGINGTNSLINVIPELAGDNCSSGGYKISSGIDLNYNDTLEEFEIQHFEYLCNGILDEEIRLNFTHENDLISSNKTTGYIGGAFFPKFNLINYYGVDSIVFGAYLETYNGSSKCIVELYDNTNKSVIQGSQITTNSLEFKLVTTNINFINNIPDGENDFTIKISPEINDVTVICHSAFIILYRK